MMVQYACCTRLNGGRSTLLCLLHCSGTMEVMSWCLMPCPRAAKARAMKGQLWRAAATRLLGRSLQYYLTAWYEWGADGFDLLDAPLLLCTAESKR
jgi:hypothetical protein